MTLQDFLKYYEAISALSASEHLTQMGISDYPHMKPENRKKYYSQFNKAVKPLKKPAPTLDEMSKMIGEL